MPLIQRTEEPAVSTEAGEPGAERAATPARGPGQERTDDELLTEAAGLLFASPEPLSDARLTELRYP